MNKRDKDKISSLYENAVFIARASDLSPEMSGEVEIKPNATEVEHKEPERDSQEVHMAKADLMQIISNAQKLTEILDNEQGLEGWVAAKITIAADYISSVTGWLEYESKNKDCGCDND